MKDKNGKILKVGDTVEMPSPNNDLGDCWQYGGFTAIITDIFNIKNTILVEDQDSDFFEVEPERVTVVEEE